MADEDIDDEFVEFVKGLCVQKGIDYDSLDLPGTVKRPFKCEKCGRSYYELWSPSHSILEYYYWPEETLITEPADSVGWELIDALHRSWAPQGFYDSGLCSRKCAIKLFVRDFGRLKFGRKFDNFYYKAVRILGLEDPANMESDWAKLFFKLVAARIKTRK